MARGLTRDLYIDWSGLWGGFMQFAVHGNLHCTIDQQVTNLHCEWGDNFAYWSGPGENSGTGYGFINVGGIMWAQPKFSRRFENSDQHGVERWDGDVLQEVLEACPAIATDAIYGAYMSDESQTPSVKGEIIGAGWIAHDFPLNGEMDLNMTLITPFTRWRDNAAGQAVVESAGSFNLTLEDIFPDYYPFAVYRGRDGIEWDALSNEALGKHLKDRRGGSWHDLKNSMRYPDDPAKNSVFVRTGSTWRQADNVMAPAY